MDDFLLVHTEIELGHFKIRKNWIAAWSDIPVATFVRSGYSAHQSLGEGELKKSECESESENTRSFHSYLNDSTGFLVAARQFCQLTVSRAIPIASTPPRAKIHQLNSVL